MRCAMDDGSTVTARLDDVGDFYVCSVRLPGEKRGKRIIVCPPVLWAKLGGLDCDRALRDAASSAHSFRLSDEDRQLRARL